MFITYGQNPNHKINANIRSKYEGVGAQYQRIVALISIAKRHNLKYIHIPINIGHNYNNDPNWNEKWDNMFNIKKLSENIDYKTIKNQYINLYPVSIEQLLKYSTTTNLIYYINPFKIFDNNSDYYLSNIQNDLINAYDENNSDRILIYDKTKINIAIHIRVFNKLDDIINYNDYIHNKNNRHYMTYDMYFNLINKLKEQYPNSDIHIFSQEDFFDIHYKKLREIENIKIHFDDLDNFDTFHHLCKSDILVMGTSSFSILAAFYNKNKIIYLPFNHPPSLKTWIVYKPS